MRSLVEQQYPSSLWRNGLGPALVIRRLKRPEASRSSRSATPREADGLKARGGGGVDKF